MAEATYLQAIAELKATIHQLEELEVYCNTASSGFLALDDAIDAAAIYEFSKDTLSRPAADRAAINTIFTPGAIAARLAGPLRNLAMAIGVPDVDPATILVRWRDYMLFTAAPIDTINSREITHATPAAAVGNTGNGVINRLVVDEDGYELEHTHIEAKRCECIVDQNLGDKHEETFLFRGAEAEKDLILVAGSGSQRTMNCFSARTSQALLINPSFSEFSGTAPTAGTPSTPATTTSVTGWVLDTAANYRVGIDTPAVYRDFVGDATPKWLKLTANGTVSQILDDNRRPKLKLNTPYYLQVAVYRESSADGTLTIHCGSQSQAFTISGFSNNAWSIYRLTLDKDLYYKNFKEADLDIKFVWASRTVGNIYLDDVIFAEMIPWDGTWYAPVGGSTAFLAGPEGRGDTFTWTDTAAATRGIIQYWLWRSGLVGVPFSLPGVAAAETIVDP